MESEESVVYTVVVNQEEQYSLWRAEQPLPLGWRDAGKGGTKEECLAYIKEVWVDMRPRSVRERVESGSDATPVVASSEDTQSALSQDPEAWDDLVNGDQAPEPSPDAG